MVVTTPARRDPDGRRDALGQQGTPELRARMRLRTP
jgi:hypothetical protein